MNRNSKQKVFSCCFFCAFALGLVISLMCGCNNGKIETPEDSKYLKDFHVDNFDQSESLLKMDDLALYVDYSTCTKLGQNAAFFQEIEQSFVTKTKHYWSIKGASITEEDLSEQGTYARLRNISEVNYAELKKAADMMASSNSESILVTDCEYFTQTMAKGNDNNPYLVDAFKKWILRGYDIHIISEPYVERNNGKDYNKKRFYIIFTDDRDKSNIYGQIVRTVHFDNYPNVDQFHLSATHPGLFGNGNNSSEQHEILMSKSQGYGMYEVEDWAGCDWGTIEEMIVNAVDENTGNALPNGDPAITMAIDKNSFGCYSIDEVGVRVYNINQEYMDYYQAKSGRSKTPKISLNSLYELENFMLVDNKTFKKNGNINILFNQQWFDPSVLEGNPNNYLKVDLIINKVSSTFNEHQGFFEFESIVRPGEMNNSVVASINQCINDADVIAKMTNQVVYSIYIKTEKSK